jgi:[ribosomal protein S5]-alanine N-acetyltransferase
VLDPEVLGPDWSGFQDAAALERRLQNGELLNDEGGLLLIDTDDGAVGEVSWHAVRYGGRPHAWNLGVAVVPEARGRGIGAQAQALVVEYLFAHTTAVRLEAYVRSDNVAECRSLQNAGFRREGVLRSAQFKDGDWRDLVMFSRLRTDDG